MSRNAVTGSGNPFNAAARANGANRFSCSALVDGKHNQIAEFVVGKRDLAGRVNSSIGSAASISAWLWLYLLLVAERDRHCVGD